MHGSTNQKDERSSLIFETETKEKLHREANAKTLRDTMNIIMRLALILPTNTRLGTEKEEQINHTCVRERLRSLCECVFGKREKVK